MRRFYLQPCPIHPTYSGSGRLECIIWGSICCWQRKEQLSHSNLKPWPNVHLRWFAMTCAHFGRDQICTQVDASFSPFGHPIQVNASWVTSINLLLANEIQDMSALKWVFCDLRVLARKLASPFGHPTQVSTQVQLVASCDYLRVRLTRA